jgi:polysaccharide biosynthesis transport protein
MYLQPKRGAYALPAPSGLWEAEQIPGYRTLDSNRLDQDSRVLHYWCVLRKRKWVILATFVCVFLIFAIATLKTRRLYEASSKIAVFPENPNLFGPRDGGIGTPMDADPQAALETQASILHSDVLALKVIEAMQLDLNPAFAGSKIKHVEFQTPTPPNVEADPVQIAELLDRFHSGLNVKLIPATSLIEIRYIHPDPRLAAAITNALVKTFIEENFKTKYEAVTQTSDWLSKELADLQLKVELSEEKLVRYQKDHGIVGIDDKQNIVTAKLDALNTELTAAQTLRIQKEAEYKMSILRGAGVPKLSNGSATLLDKLREKEADLNTQYAEATTRFGSSFPKVVELNSQREQVRAEIAAEQRRIQKRIFDEYETTVQREKMLASAFEQQKQAANQLNENSIEYSVLKHDAESNRHLYESLLQRLKEASVTAGLKSSNIRVVDVARIPIHPAKPDVARNMAFGVLMGLLGGIALAFVLETMDSTVSGIEEIGSICPLPALGVIPFHSHNGHHKRLRSVTSHGQAEALKDVVTYVRPKSEAAESYRALRTSILLSTFGTPPKIILVTSALPQEGKTTVSSNSAIVLAQRGSRVLLVDADLRRPGIGKILDITSRGGLTTLLSGADKPENVILSCPLLKNLSILPAGPVPSQPAELLSSILLENYIERWRNEFDHIIIDTPPCLSVTDAVVLSTKADRVILVARSGQTPKKALRRACELLYQVNAKVMGIVLNAFDVDSADGHYYCYGKKYSRYYEQAEQMTPETQAS